VKRKLYLSAAVIAIVAAFAAGAIAATSGSQVKTWKSSSLGATILVDSKSHTLYLFMKDKSGKSSCTGACAANWPPYLTTAKPRAGVGAKAALLGTAKRSDGKLQVTYNHHPLYRFKFDTKAHSTKGEKIEAFGGEWFAVSSKGAKVEPESSSGGGYGGGPTGASGPTGYGGYGGYGG
jgi:predicted lipoprotein with Yx(FWY)xxD motif